MFADLTPAAVRRFVLGEDRGWGAGTIHVVGGALRCYLQFRRMEGDDVHRLLAAIPRPAHWQLAGLPDGSSRAQIAMLLAPFAQDFPSPTPPFASVQHDRTL